MKKLKQFFSGSLADKAVNLTIGLFVTIAGSFVLGILLSLFWLVFYSGWRCVTWFFDKVI